MDVDDDCRLQNVIWIHPRSRAAYEEFHDVISFDTTYLVNQYQMPLATVVGVNQHNQSILLGCALLSHETDESFKWFFKNWIVAMNNVYPMTILTDQCESIGIVVREVMPNTVHRYCLWHIATKTSNKFKGVADMKKCVSDFYSVVYDSLSIADFEGGWNQFLTEHDLGNNKWLKDLFSQREYWVPIYLNHMFWVGMVSTQMSESMHAFFDGYINSRSALKRFVEQYEVVVTDKIMKEMKADFESKCVILRPVSKQVRLISNCNVQEVIHDGEDDAVGVEKYEVLETCILRNRFHKQGDDGFQGVKPRNNWKSKPRQTFTETKNNFVVLEHEDEHVILDHRPNLLNALLVPSTHEDDEHIEQMNEVESELDSSVDVEILAGRDSSPVQRLDRPSRKEQLSMREGQARCVFPEREQSAERQMDGKLLLILSVIRHLGSR
ncbi:protein FAR1-RELATED SEQUENCE 5-like [Salvia miltiorrhiza]|uniref:protein FAR1-RELATED SEQUENCE 5-like n=1 Tax=Salvia miltiorrhiza TaxID=226208 RepID=UPI0025ABE022|nr:protein FAR1-RELATED SEQUENCE 5-like [Salvia miltiorrhiza]